MPFIESFDPFLNWILGRCLLYKLQGWHTPPRWCHTIARHCASWKWRVDELHYKRRFYVNKWNMGFPFHLCFTCGMLFLDLIGKMSKKILSLPYLQSLPIVKSEMIMINRECNVYCKCLFYGKNKINSLSIILFWYLQFTLPMRLSGH